MSGIRNLTVLFWLLAVGCGLSPSTDGSGSEEKMAGAESGSTPDPGDSEAPPVPPPSPLPYGGVSNDGTYFVRYRPSPDPIPENEPFALEVQVFEDEGHSRLATDIALRADAGMPQHRHGMIRAPEVAEKGPGQFQVEGMLFHMSGAWELYFDIRREAITERAQFEVVLD